MGQRPSSFLVNGEVLVDAGTGPAALNLAEQLAIKHVLVSHAHLDHVAGLAFLTDTFACRRDGHSLTVTSVEPVVEALRASIFNGIVWPDFTRIPDPAVPIVRFTALVEEEPQPVGPLWVMPVRVHHSVPAVGYVVHDGTRGFVYSGDTGPTQRLWACIRHYPGIQAIVLECSFPDRLSKLADVSVAHPARARQAPARRPRAHLPRQAAVPRRGRRRAGPPRRARQPGGAGQDLRTLAGPSATHAPPARRPRPPAPGARRPSTSAPRRAPSSPRRARRTRHRSARS